jgi:hypothetical protein
VEPTIHQDWQHALMEAVRTLDERANGSLRQSGSFPAIRMDDSVFDRMSVPPAEGEARARRGGSGLNGVDSRGAARSPGVASSLVDRGFAALRAGNIEEARQCWLAAKKLDPENRSLDLNLRKLESRAAR